MYNITQYSYKRAKELGVDIKPSSHKNKKIDVFKDGKFLISIGDIRYKDYPTYIKEKGKVFADSRRLLYQQRHKNNKGLAGRYASAILW